MKLTDIQPLEKWMELEKEIQRRSGLSASVFDTDGIRITDFLIWPNRLCPEIKANDKGQSFICAVAHMNIANDARRSRTPRIEACDGGLMKIVVPIFAGDVFAGAVGACGLLPEGEEVDLFLINKITGIDESRLEALSEGVGTLSMEAAESLAGFIASEIERIVSGFASKRSRGSEGAGN